jgi:outer membrane protein TolC
VNRIQSNQNALDDLVLALGLPVGSFPELTDPVPYAPVQVDVTAAIREALAHRSELEQFRIQRAQAQIDLAVTKDQKRPKADIVANITRLGLAFLGRGNLGNLLASALGLRVSVPVSKRTLEENLASAERQVAILDYLESFQQQQIVDEVRGLVRAAETARQNLELLTENLKIAQRGVQISQRFIEEGLKDNRDLLEAQQQVTNTESSILDAKVNYFLTMVSLRRALGQDLLKQFDVTPLRLPERPLLFAPRNKTSPAAGPVTVSTENTQFGREAYPASLR